MSIDLSRTDAAILLTGIALSLVGSVLANLLVVYLVRFLDLFPTSQDPLWIIGYLLVFAAAFAGIMWIIISRLKKVVQE
jgi:apolipoprotein N-acyltransferase